MDMEDKICPCCGHGENCTLHICDKDKFPVIIKLRKEITRKNEVGKRVINEKRDLLIEIEKLQAKLTQAHKNTGFQVGKVNFRDFQLRKERAENRRLQAKITGAYNRGYIKGLAEGRE